MKGDIGVFDVPNLKCKRLSRRIPHAIQDVIASKDRNLAISNIFMKHGSNAGDIQNNYTENTSVDRLYPRDGCKNRDGYV